MKPEVDQILNLSAMQMLGTIAPLLPSGYATGSASLLAFMMMLSAQEYDRAADIRVVENTDMRALFAELAPRVDAGLRGKLEAAAATKDASLKISALDASNADLRKLLAELHEAIESDKTANRRVWTVLKAMADRRVLKLPGQ
ncbi:MAG TPA: hypothetical protein VGF56_13835 [Rhizomicrobium sp.]|jgi:hypothetical protein